MSRKHNSDMRRFAGYALLMVLTASTYCSAQKMVVEQYRFGDFLSGQSISVDQFQNAYITDGVRNMVYKYSIKGELLASVGGRGWGNTQFDEPMGIDASLGVSVYVADYNNNRIVRYDKDLHFLGSFSTPDNSGADASFGYPRDVALSPIGNMFIVDEENKRIIYSAGFASIEQTFGNTVAGEERLQQPIALATGPDNNLFILEPNRIVVYDVFGNPVRSFGSQLIVDAVGICNHGRIVAVICPSAIHFFLDDGTVALSLDANNMVFAGEAGNFRDAVFTQEYLLLLTDQSVIVLTNPFSK